MIVYFVRCIVITVYVYLFYCTFDFMTTIHTILLMVYINFILLYFDFSALDMFY